MADLTPEGILAKRGNTTDIVLSADLLSYAARHYVRPEEAVLPLASPFYADLHGLPPLFLQVGEHEILREEVEQLEKRVRSQGVRAHCITWGNMFHGWHAFADTLVAGHLAFDQVAAYLEKYFTFARIS